MTCTFVTPGSFSLYSMVLLLPLLGGCSDSTSSFEEQLKLSDSLTNHEVTPRFDEKSNSLSYELPGHVYNDRAEIVYHVPFFNRSDRHLVVTDVATSCGCSSATPLKTTLSPGESTFLDVKIAPPSSPSIRILLRFEDNAPLTYNLSCNLYDRVSRSPSGLLYFGRLYSGGVATLDLRIITHWNAETEQRPVIRKIVSNIEGATAKWSERECVSEILGGEITKSTQPVKLTLDLSNPAKRLSGLQSGKFTVEYDRLSKQDVSFTWWAKSHFAITPARILFKGSQPPSRRVTIAHVDKESFEIVGAQPSTSAIEVRLLAPENGLQESQHEIEVALRGGRNTGMIGA